MSPRHNLSFCAWKTAWLSPESLVSMCPSPHLWFLQAKQRIFVQNFSLYGSQPWSAVFACQTACFGPKLEVSMGPRPYLSFCACKTAWFAPEYQVYMGPSPHVWFLDAKQQLMDRNNKTLWVPDITCRFVLAKQRDFHQNVKFIWVPALICVFFSCKTTTLWPDLQVCMGPRPHLWFWANITAWLVQE